jgi:hypothetical protein
MFVKHSAVVPQHSLVILNQPQNLNIPHYHILILAWSALFILYGEVALSLSVLSQRTSPAQSVAHR